MTQSMCTASLAARCMQRPACCDSWQHGWGVVMELAIIMQQLAWHASQHTQRMH